MTACVVKRSVSDLLSLSFDVVGIDALDNGVVGVFFIGVFVIGVFVIGVFVIDVFPNRDIVESDFPRVETAGTDAIVDAGPTHEGDGVDKERS